MRQETDQASWQRTRFRMGVIPIQEPLKQQDREIRPKLLFSGTHRRLSICVEGLAGLEYPARLNV